ncbi:MAG: type IV pilus modification protein PilV [Gammaproteobacteria bacterium]|nr:type IV pilus modification protein PilV [Gammaproteobacteria bacterium]
MMNTNNRRNRQAGFTLIEVMVSVLVLGIGLLGLTALQAQGLRGGSSAQQRTQATLLAYDMIERLRADYPAAIAGDYNLDVDEDPAEDATFQVEQQSDWLDTLGNLLTNGDGAIDCDADGNCTITIQWDDSRASGDANDATRQFVFTTQI